MTARTSAASDQSPDDAASLNGAARPERLVIGWRERVSIPAWEIHGLIAKADTGARSSAIDVSDIVELPGNRVRFRVVQRRREPAVSVVVETAISRRTRVRSSQGEVQPRLMVVATLRIGPVEKEIEVGLVSRPDMLCRMLLGRETLKRDFLVDPGRTYALKRRRRKKKREARKLKTGKRRPAER